MVHLLDDFHNIQTIKHPTSLKLSAASHMASNLLDIQNIPAIPLPKSQDNRHSMVLVHKEDSTITCKGGINIKIAQGVMTKALENHSVTYLESLPSSHQHINTEMINKQISQFR